MSIPISSSRVRRRIRTAIAVATLAPTAFGCGSDSFKPEALQNPDELYWDLTLNHHAVTLSMTAPYDTLTLVPIALNYRGDTLSGLPAPTYHSQDADVVVVSADGELVAQAASPQRVWVVATLTTKNLKHRDSVLVLVTDNPTPPVLGTFSIHPVSPDSAKTAARLRTGGEFFKDTISVHMADAGGVPMDSSAYPVWFNTSDATIARTGRSGGCGVRLDIICGVRPGAVDIYASATVYGVAKVDTLPYRIGWPLQGLVSIVRDPDHPNRNIFQQSEVTIGAGGMVLWQSSLLSVDTLVDVDVTFDDPTNVAAINTSPIDISNPEYGFFLYFLACLYGDCNAAGNFLLHPKSYTPGGSAARLFPVPGVYEYRSNINNATARVIVMDESRDN